MKAIVIATMALLFLVSCKSFNTNSTSKNIDNISLIIYNSDVVDFNNKAFNKNDIYSTFPLKKNDTFSIEFMHSVNRSPVVEYYKFDDNNDIYVYKTIYYNFGAGVPTEITGNERLTYGDDGSIIIDNIDKKIDNLTYYLSNIYDHVLKINDKYPISLWDVCGKNKIITIKIINN